MKFYLHLKATSLMLLVLFLWVGTAPAHDDVWPTEKLKSMFPEALSFEQRNLEVSAKQQRRLEETLGSSLPEEDLLPSIYFAIKRETPGARPKRVAVLFFVDAHGSGGKIEVGLVVDQGGNLAELHVFENSESPEVSSQTFIKQFSGKKQPDSFQVGQDIISPPAHVESSQAIATGARRGLLLVNELLKRKQG